MRLVFTAYNRSIYFERTLRSWSEVRLPDGLLVPIMVHLEPSEMLWEMRRLIPQYIPQAGICTHPDRLGVLENPFHAFASSFAEPGELGDFTVLAEDDVVVSTDVMEYFWWASEEYAADQSVLGVCAFSRLPGEQPVDQVQLVGDFCPLVWGTWRDRWETIIGPTWDHAYNSGPTPGYQQGWDWNINLRVLGERRFVFPCKSRSDHIGKVGGSHCTPEDFLYTQAPSFSPEIEAQSYLVPK